MSVPLQKHELYDSERIEAFQADVTTENCFGNIQTPVDIVTLVFVLSAIHPDKFPRYDDGTF